MSYLIEDVKRGITDSDHVVVSMKINDGQESQWISNVEVEGDTPYFYSTEKDVFEDLLKENACDEEFGDYMCKNYISSFANILLDFYPEAIRSFREADSDDVQLIRSILWVTRCDEDEIDSVMNYLKGKSTCDIEIPPLDIEESATADADMASISSLNSLALGTEEPAADDADRGSSPSKGYYFVSGIDSCNTWNYAFTDVCEAKALFKQIAQMIHHNLEEDEYRDASECDDDYLGDWYPSESIYQGFADDDWRDWFDEGAESAVCWEYNIQFDGLRLQFYLVGEEYGNEEHPYEVYGTVTLRYVPLFDDVEDALSFDQNLRMHSWPFDGWEHKDWDWGDGTTLRDHDPSDDYYWPIEKFF